MELPIKTKNDNGNERHIGLEVEYANLPLEDTAQVIQDLFGGAVHKDNDAVYKVNDTKLGDFKLELDAIPLQKLADSTHKLEKKDEGSFLDDMNLQVSKAIGDAGTKFVPFEITSPPVKLSQLPELEKLRTALRAKGATDTKENFYSAFGLHINPEVASLETPYILRHLQGFLLLAPWLQDTHKIDLTRKMTNFIDPFPIEYLELVLDKDYAPEIDQLIEDYHEHNPTRNRALDMLPLFAHINESLIRGLYGDKEKINIRPTFHYRLPNCELADPKWSFDKEWKRWLHVEYLGNNEQALHRLIEKWQKHQKRWISLESEWVTEVKRNIQDWT